MNKKPPERCSVQAVCRGKPCEYTAKNTEMLFKLILAQKNEPVKRKGNKMKTMLTIKETAEKYGLPVFWVRCAVKQHKVPFITLGRKILINGEIFEAFLKGGAPDEQA